MGHQPVDHGVGTLANGSASRTPLRERRDHDQTLALLPNVPGTRPWCLRASWGSHLLAPRCQREEHSLAISGRSQRSDRARQVLRSLPDISSLRIRPDVSATKRSPAPQGPNIVAFTPQRNPKQVTSSGCQVMFLPTHPVSRNHDGSCRRISTSSTSSMPPP